MENREVWEEVLQLKKLNSLLLRYIEKSNLNITEDNYIKDYNYFMQLKENILLEVKEQLVLVTGDFITFELKATKSYLTSLNRLFSIGNKIKGKSVKCDSVDELWRWICNYVLVDVIVLFDDFSIEASIDLTGGVSSPILTFLEGGKLKQEIKDKGYMGFDC